MDARGQLQKFLWAQKLRKKSEIIQILLSHSPQYGDVQVVQNSKWLKMAATNQLQIFLWAQKLYNLMSEIIQIILSHPPAYRNLYVIFFKVLLKFKMAVTDQLQFFVGAKT